MSTAPAPIGPSDEPRPDPPIVAAGVPTPQANREVRRRRGRVTLVPDGLLDYPLIAEYFGPDSFSYETPEKGKSRPQ